MEEKQLRTQALVIGSGAGGAITAATLARNGLEVLILEEGPNIDTSTISSNSPEAIARLYRNRGMTPILGNQSIAYVEGRCVGGSTEVNSAFWHRIPPDCYHRWCTDALLVDFSPEVMEPYFEQIEKTLHISYLNTQDVPRSSALFRQGIEKLRWKYVEVPRCQHAGASKSQFAPGAKQSMQRTYIPQALRAGAQLLPECKAAKILHDNGAVRGVQAVLGTGTTRSSIEILADHVFVCCGAVQTPALLRRSGITHNVGNNLCIHPMIKAAALFEEDVEAHLDPIPIYQVKEFWPTITIGGSVFSPGFLAMLLSDSWRTTQFAMRDWSRMGLYYAASRGMNRGKIRTLPGMEDGTVVFYRISEADQRNLSAGLAYLCEILFAAGAKAVFPSIRSQPVLRSAEECRGFLKNPLAARDMSLSTVHAFSSCPMGENADYCATDSFGRVNGFRNLYVNDASLIPNSPGVNPQGTTMAIALRNVEHFLSRRKAHRVRKLMPHDTPPKPAVLITGASGWLGTRLVEVLLEGSPGVPGFEAPRHPASIRCLVRSDDDAEKLTALAPQLQLIAGDLRRGDDVKEFCRGAEGAILFHIAGVIHPERWTADFVAVNVEGTRRVVAAAESAGVRRLVAVSSNSPFGFNRSPEELFDESSPYNPYMGYGESKRMAELLIKEAQARGRLETVIIRPPWFYGPHQPPRQTLFFKMIKEGRFPILGDGNQKRSMAYIDNICQGLLLSAVAPAAVGQAYWIADERPYTIHEIVETVESVLEEDFGIACSRRRMRLPRVAGDVARLLDGFLQKLGLYHQKVHVLGEMNATIACSIEKARREIGYSPRFALREGMAASIRWCLANGLRF